MTIPASKINKIKLKAEKPINIRLLWTCACFNANKLANEAKGVPKPPTFTPRKIETMSVLNRVIRKVAGTLLIIWLNVIPVR